MRIETKHGPHCQYCNHHIAHHTTHLPRSKYGAVLCTTDGRGVPICTDCDDCFHGL